jgi:hypothetical protein
MISLDNKQLDRREYNLWTIRTTGEEITDEDWLSVRGKTMINLRKSFRFINIEHAKLDTDEGISKAKFIELNKFEVQDQDTSEHDLWNGLKCIGFNYALELDMVCLKIFL